MSRFLPWQTPHGAPSGPESCVAAIVQSCAIVQVVALPGRDILRADAPRHARATENVQAELFT